MSFQQRTLLDIDLDTPADVPRPGLGPDHPETRNNISYCAKLLVSDKSRHEPQADQPGQ